MLISKNACELLKFLATCDDWLLPDEISSAYSRYDQRYLNALEDNGLVDGVVPDGSLPRVKNGEVLFVKAYRINDKGQMYLEAVEEKRREECDRNRKFRITTAIAVAALIISLFTLFVQFAETIL